MTPEQASKPTRGEVNYALAPSPNESAERMNTNPRPSVWMLLGGGALLFLSTFLKWYGEGSFGYSAWETDIFGFLGIFLAVMGLATAITVGLTTFAGTKLPADILGFTWNQIYMMFGFTASIVTIGYLFTGHTKIGLFLGLIGSLVMLAGAFMESQVTAKPSGPPTAF